MCKKDFMVKKWMISELGLSGNELVCFAFLYDATKGGSEEYQGGYKQLTEVMNTTIPTTYNVPMHSWLMQIRLPMIRSTTIAGSPWSRTIIPNGLL